MKTAKEWAKDCLERFELAGAEASCQEVVEVIVMAVREECAKAAEEEPVLPGPIPADVEKQMLKAIENGKHAEICRIFAGGMQRAIAKRIRAL